MRILVLLLSTLVIAEERQCFSGQYILSVSSVKSKAKNELKSAKEILPLSAVATEATREAILIETNSSNGKTEEFNRANFLCRFLNDRIRSEKRSNRIGLRRFPATCECNEAISMLNTPNDQYNHLLWGLNQEGNIDSNAKEAWTLTTGSKSVVVGVLDTGIDYTHPDISPNMWANSQEIPGNGIDDDGNGYVDDIYGINAIANSGNPMDDHGHGTHCAGTIGAKGNNSIGVVGVSWNVSMVGAKFLPKNGYGSLMDAVKGLNYFADLKQYKGVNLVVSNNSWGGGGYSTTLYNAIKRHRDLGIVFVAAAGNNSTNVDVTPSYPGSYNLSNIINVAAHASSGSLASFSNYGANSVHISAPGVSIASTVQNGGYSYMQGTSMAAPHVSGAIALLASYRPGLDGAMLKDTILNNATSLGTLSGAVIGQRALNVHAALLNAQEGVPTNTPTPIATSTPTVIPTATATPTVTPTPTPMKPNASIQGVVSTSSGQALSGVQIMVQNIDTNAQEVRFTDSNGGYSFSGLKTGQRYILYPSSSGHSFNPSHYEVTLVDDVGVNFFRSNITGYSIKVHLLSKTKRPIQGKQIVGHPNLGTITTNHLGQAWFHVPIGTNYKFTVNDPTLPLKVNELSGTVHGDVDRVFVTLTE